MSLLVNLLAICLIGYKAWCVNRWPKVSGPMANIGFTRAHWRILREHFSRGRRKSRVIKALVMLVESRAIYSALLASVIYQSGVLCPDDEDGYAPWHSGHRDDIRGEPHAPLRARGTPECIPLYSRGLHLRRLHPRYCERAIQIASQGAKYLGLT